ncbi:protein phosphatase CheZ [Acidisphaera sp. L21]|uniref:protein phosphatase CheZ n=1 Tax=Acidisphaera sp. L21 TaxID=1641851 RepID=UPI00131E2106|nr:protein phosphatase CheZ [Acidisphaera sp. L21]
MVNSGVAPDGLAQRLSELHGRIAVVEPEAETVSAGQYAALLSELRILADFIDAARQEVAAVGVDEIVGRDVPAATDELDAVVMHTAEATGLILDECEHLDAIVAKTELRTDVTAMTARIYEACSFQDITGQRVAKVVHTLKTIEAKIADMLRVFGRGPMETSSVIRPVVLLNGPQRVGDAMDQGAVDALLASFE